jgi:hypothetical protein
VSTKKSTKFNFSIDPELKAQLFRRALAEERTPSSLVRSLLRRELGSYEPLAREKHMLQFVAAVEKEAADGE